MAGPFHLFRRYQKTMLAVFGVLLMITFVITSSPNTFMGTPERGDPVVFTTRQGEVRERELQHLVEARRLSHRFLLEASTLAVRNLMQEQSLQSIPPQQIHEILLNNLMQDGIDVRHEVSEEALVKSMIVADKAKEVGLVVSDESINEFLRDRMLKKVSPEQFLEIIKQLKVPKRELFNSLRLELEASRLRQMVFGISATRGVTPGMRWDYFERLNRQANALTMGVPVDGFLAQVGQPDEGQLQALFNEHKDDYTIPGSPEPGFRRPEQGKYDYFKADYEKFAATIEVSDADVLDYYEKNKKAQFPYSGIEAPPASSTEPKDEPDPPADAEGKADDNADEKADSTPESDAASKEPTESSTPAADEEPEAPLPDATPAPSGPQGNGGDDAAGDETAADEVTDDKVADETAAGEATSQSEAPESADEPNANQQAPALNPPATPPGESTDPAAAAADPAAADASLEQPAAVADPIVDPDEDMMLPENILAGPNPEFEPLWRVQDKIREAIRRQRAGEKVRLTFQRLAESVDDYASQFGDYDQLVGEVGAEKAGPPPTVPDYAALAAKHGVTFHTTPLLSPFDADQSELGKSYIQATQPFVEGAFAPLRLRIVRQSVDIDGNQFLFWKTEEKHDYIPSFEEAHEAVERAWKTQQARQLALKKAQELAQEVNRSGKTLQELFGAAGTYQVSTTGEFSWMTEPSAASPEMGMTVPEISTVTGVDQPGDEFMRTVFSLEPGKAGAALNGPQTVAYVVQVTEFAPAEVFLRERFMLAPYRLYAGAAIAEERKLAQDWMAQLEKEANLEWSRPPDERLR